MKITVSQEIRERCPQFVGAAVLAEVSNSEYNTELWQEITAFLDDYRARYTPDSIKEMPAIEATREAYRRCGKDPSRYRPSGEALIRRTLKGHELYQVSTLVDLINLASIAYGYSIGGFDADKIKMPPHSASADAEYGGIVLGIGREGEPYEGIGRGSLNIAGLPVYRDALGGIGTPTSDHERTKLSLSTQRLLAIVNGYDGNRSNVLACAQFIQTLLQKYAASDGGSILEFSA